MLAARIIRGSKLAGDAELLGPRARVMPGRANALLFAQGDRDSDFIVVTQGQVVISTQRASLQGAFGHVLGELSCVLHVSRYATVRTADAQPYLVLPRDALAPAAASSLVHRFSLLRPLLPQPPAASAGPGPGHGGFGGSPTSARGGRGRTAQSAQLPKGWRHAPELFEAAAAHPLTFVNGDRALDADGTYVFVAGAAAAVLLDDGRLHPLELGAVVGRRALFRGRVRVRATAASFARLPADFASRDDEPLALLRATLQSADVGGVWLLEMAMNRGLLQAGETLCTVGDVSTYCAVIESGSVRVSLPGRAGVGLVSAGQLFGEAGLLRHAQRSGTAVAVRDTVLWRIQAPEFHVCVNGAPAIGFQLWSLAYERMTKPLHSCTPCSVVSVCALTTEAACAFAEQLAQVLSACFVSRVGDFHDLHELEATQRWAFVLLPLADDVDADADEWSAYCRRSSDQYVCVAERPWAASRCRRLDDDKDVLLVRAHNSPAGAYEASAWLPQMKRDLGAQHVVHCRPGVPADLERVGRFVRRQPVVVVLSGGGARSLCHVGVLQRLREKRVPVDVLVGCSGGALVGALFALDPDSLERHLTMVKTAHLLLPLTATLPITSVFSGRLQSWIVRRIFGHTHSIEELPLGFACVSTDLSSSALNVHDSGDLSAAVLASGCVPVLMPPVAHSLVDGGLMDNLPVTVARRRFPKSTIVAVDVASEAMVCATRASSGSGWLRLGASGVATLGSVVNSILTMSSRSRDHENRAASDVYLAVECSAGWLNPLAHSATMISAGREAVDGFEGWEGVGLAPESPPLVVSVPRASMLSLLGALLWTVDFGMLLVLLGLGVGASLGA